MQLQDLKAPVGSRKRRKIVGRGPGSGHGKTSCRGQKGQRSRGQKYLSSLEGGQVPLIRRIPKLGFNSKRPVLNQIVNIDSLNRFEKDAVITGEALKSKGLIKSLTKPFKILGDGVLKKALTVQVPSISKEAREKIISAGGKVEIVEVKASDKMTKE